MSQCVRPMLHSRVRMQRRFGTMETAQLLAEMPAAPAGPHDVLRVSGKAISESFETVEIVTGLPDLGIGGRRQLRVRQP